MVTRCHGRYPFFFLVHDPIKKRGFPLPQSPFELYYNAAKRTCLDEFMAPNDDPLKMWRFDENGVKVYPWFRTAIIISIVIGIAVTSYLIFKMDEPYSAFYIFPDSINYSAADHAASFSYGISSHENGATTYSLNIYAGDTLERTNQYELARGESAQYHEILSVPVDALLPLKISLQLRSDRGGTEETHFWLQNSISK